MSEKLYHITPIENMSSIQEEGIRAGEDGYIYFITEKHIAGLVAKNQIFLEDSFSLFEINPEYLSNKLEADNVGEITAKWQCRVKQAAINKDGIRFDDNYFINHDEINKIYQSFHE